MRLLLLFLLYATALSVALGRRGLRPGAAAVQPTPDRRLTRVLIVGATGGTGRQLVAQALERGYAVTALARDPATLQVEHRRLDVVRGDVLDYASLDAATRGQDAVLCALGHKRFFYPTRILSEGTRNLLRAMEAHGVERLVCETALGIGESAGRMGLYYTLFVVPVILPFYFWDKTRQERLIGASRAAWVVVRPGALTDGEKRGGYRHGHNVGSFVWTVRISRADVADFMLNQLTDDTYLRAAPGVCWLTNMSPEDFRRIALAMKDAIEGAHMGHPDFRVRDKIFATLHPDHKFGMVKLTPEQQQAIVGEHPATFAPENGAWGRAGCTSVRLESVDEDTLGEAMTLAWQNIARRSAARRPKVKRSMRR